MKVVINRCFGGFGLSQAVFDRLIERGMPVVPHFEQQRDPVTKLFLPEPRNEGEVIVDWEHPESTGISESSLRLCGRYHASWLKREDPRLVRAVEELGDRASGSLSKLVVVEIPDGIEYEIDDYDGMESIHEKHRSWT